MSFKFICLFQFIVVLSAFSQDTDTRYVGKKTLPFAVIETIDSHPLKEQRTLNVYLPHGYHPDSAATYPTVYVLDGSAHEDFLHIAGLFQFMNMYELAPKSIVVGIANVDRYRDFTFPSTDTLDQRDLPTSGGAAKFMEFVVTEVQPLINKNYKTNGTNTIIGQSLGGLMATEFLMKRPELFADYIIVSPSLWWNKQDLVNGAAAYFKAQKDFKKRIFISLGQEHPVMHEVADRLVAAIRNAGDIGAEVYYDPILDEDHATILHSAVYAGLKRLHTKKQKH